MAEYFEENVTVKATICEFLQKCRGKTSGVREKKHFRKQIILSSEEMVDIVGENGAMIEDILFSDIIVDERETEIGSNANESVVNINAESPLDWSKYRPTMLEPRSHLNMNQ